METTNVIQVRRNEASPITVPIMYAGERRNVHFERSFKVGNLPVQYINEDVFVYTYRTGTKVHKAMLGMTLEDPNDNRWTKAQREDGSPFWFQITHARSRFGNARSTVYIRWATK